MPSIRLSDFNGDLAQLIMARAVENQQFIVMAPANAAMFKACLEFQGRDHRRIKREMNRAYKKASRLNRQIL